MATVAEKSADLAVPEWAPSDSVDEKVDRYLAARLKAVGDDYRSVAITTFLLASAIGLVLWLGAGVVADHWLVPGGLDRTLRVAWLVVAAAAVVVAAINWVVPLVRYRVNLVYAARSIERANPELRNDVVNTVLVRARPQRIPAMVVSSLEHRTAKRLSKLPADIVVDRGPALRLAMVLAILVGLACLYAVFSPKSLGTSLARLVAPLSRVAPPTRVLIGEPELGWRLPAGERGGDDVFHAIPVKEGRATIVRNRQLVVRSRIRGMAAGEEAMVEAAGVAEDGTIDRVAGWRSRMEQVVSSGGGGGFEATLPGGGHGLSNDLIVSVAAGDARSEPVRIVVVDAPSLLVKQVKLLPPAYTRREPEILEWQGDVSGIEGTKVTLLAESKDPLEMAAIDFGCDGQGLVKLKIDPGDLARASGSFDLRLTADRSGPWERNYRLVFRPRGWSEEDGRERGIEHRINVVADTIPEVRIVEPAKPVVKVPPEKPVAVGVEAVDPDFALRSVAIEIELERNGERMPRAAQSILEREFAGPFRGQAVFKPTSVGGQAGDRLHYRAVAVDTKSPSPNAVRTEWFTFELDAAAPPRAVPQDRQQQTQDGQQGRAPQGSGDGQADGARGSNGGKGNASDASNGGEGGGKQNAAGAGTSGGGQAAKNSGKQSQQQSQQGSGEQGSGPPEKGSQGARSEGAGGSADGSSEPSQQPSGAGGEGQSQDGKQQGDGQQDGNGQQQGNGQGDREQGQQQGGQQQGGQQQGGQQQGGQQQGGGDRKGQQQNSRNTDGGSGRERAGEQPSPDDTSIASDGTNDGEAIERILEERAKDGGDAKKTGGEKSGGEKSGGEKSGGETSGGADEKPASGAESGGVTSGESPECRPEEGKPCGNKECSKCRGGGSQGGGSGQDGGSSGGGGESKLDGKQGDKQGGKQGGEQGGKQGGEGDGKGAGERAGDRGSGKSGASQDAGSQNQKPGGSQQAGGGNSGEGKSGGAKPGDSEVGRPGEDLDNDAPEADRKPSKDAGIGGRAGRGLGGWDAGGAGQPSVGQAASREADWGEENLSHARNAVDLAVEHLKRSMDEGRSDVLDSLGWTREQAQAFLDRWARMAKDAKEGGPRKQRDFDRAVRSLGLTPSGVRRSRETVEQSRGNDAEGRRSQPPPEYREQFRAFTRGLRPDGG